MPIMVKKLSFALFSWSTVANAMQRAVLERALVILVLWNVLSHAISGYCQSTKLSLTFIWALTYF